MTSNLSDQTVSLSDSVWVWVFSGSLEKRWEDWLVKGEAGREINPSGFGLLLRTDKFSLEVSHQFTERLTASVKGMFLVADSIKTATVRTSFPENRLIYVTPKLSWRISEWWTMDVLYTYAQRDVPSATQTALANSGSIMFTYYPPKWSFGR